MSIATVRDELAAGITATGSAYGYARPPGQISTFPAAVVVDPTEITYHLAAGRRTRIRLPIRVIVARTAAQDAVVRLDELITYTELPADIEAITGSWTDIAVLDSIGGYVDFRQADRLVGVAADLNVQITINN